MNNTIKSLIGLRSKLIIKNSNILVLILMPLIFSILYNEILSNGENGMQILFISLSFTFSFAVGTLITTTIAEEKEKNNLKSLKLIGVKSLDYILATLFYPIVLSIISILGYPFLVDYIDLNGIYVEYFVVSSFTALACILFYFLIASFSDTQSKAQINSILAMTVIVLIPMFASLNDIFETINKYTFMANFTEFFAGGSTSILQTQSFLILIIWIFGLFIVDIFVYKKGI